MLWYMIQLGTYHCYNIQAVNKNTLLTKKIVHPAHFVTAVIYVTLCRLNQLSTVSNQIKFILLILLQDI